MKVRWGWAAGLFGLGVAAALGKYVQLEWHPGTGDVRLEVVVRQLLVLVAVLGFSVWTPGPLTSATTPPPPSLAGPYLRSIGLLSTFPSTSRSRGRWARAALGAGAVVAVLVAVSTPVDGTGRWVAVGVGGGLLVGLVGWEWGRHRLQPPGTTPPDRAVLWTVAPLVLAAGGAAVVLGIRGGPSELSDGELTNLLFVTALGEELIFRGVVLSTAYRLLQRGWAEALTIATFALWHLGNALTDDGPSTFWQRLGLVAVTLLVTAAGGALFSLVRHRGRTLAGSVLVHTATNLPGLVLLAGP